MYVCHKGFHAINAMAVRNAELSFTNFVCRWQGSVHDSAVFNSSMLHAYLEDGGGQNGWLLGDPGYGIQPYLLTPFRPDDRDLKIQDGSEDNGGPEVVFP